MRSDHEDDRPFGYHEALSLSALHVATTEEGEGVDILPSMRLGSSDDLSMFGKDQTDVIIPSFLQQEPVYPDVSVGRNLRRIISANTTSSNEQDMIIIDPFDGHSDTGLLYCHIPALLRYSRGGEGGEVSGGTSSSSPSATAATAGPDFSGSNGDTVGGGNTGAIAYAASAAILLGFHHANTGDGSVAPALAGLHRRCPLRFTTEILDEGGSGLDAVRSLTTMVSRDPNSQQKQQQQAMYPQPCALIGAHVSSATEKLASLASVFDLPVVSSSAMSTTLNDPKQYPLFARTHTDVGGFGTMAVSFFKHKLGVRHKIGMLYIHDAYGHGFSNSVFKASTQEGLEVAAAAYHIDDNNPRDTLQSIRLALQALKESGCNYFVGSFYPGSMARIMGMAYDMGVAGPGKFWLISGTADIAPFVLGGALKLPKNSSAVKAIQGTGMYFCEGGVPGLGGSYDTFWKKWKEMGDDTQALEYINNKQPLKKDGSGTRYAFPPVFGKKPHHVVTFSYDAAAGLALSACDAWENNQQSNNSGPSETAAFSGAQHHSIFSNSSYYGASGLVEMGQDFPTRTAESSYFVMANLLPVEHNETHLTFKGSPIVNFFNTTGLTWKVLGGKQFVYPDDTTTPPEELIPLLSNENNEMIHTSTILLAVAICAIITMMVSLICYLHRQKRKADELWNIELEELDFGSEEKMLGMGSFGMVLLAEYRGSRVAVKQVLPSRYELSGKSNKEVTDEEAALNARGIQSVSWSHNSSTGSHWSFGGTLSGLDLFGTGSEAPRRGFLNISSRSSVGALLPGGRIMQRQRVRADFVREMRQLAALRHPNITTTVGAVLSPGKEPMMVMEYLENGSLYDCLRNKSISLNGKEDILTIIQDVAHGIHFLHSAKPRVVHGDLKSKNILIDSNFRAKIGDFGLSAKNKAGAKGTPYWMAPELLRKESSNTAMSDIYAFGILLFEVYSRENPYKGEEYAQVIADVADARVRKRPPVPSSCPPKISALMTNCWQDRPEDRPTAKEIDSLLQGEGTIQGRFVRIEALNKELLEKNDAISSEQAKQLEHFASMSHEIRTPLNCVIGLSSLLEEDETLNSCQKDSVNMIVSSGRLLRQVVDDVLDFSKFISGNAEIDIKRVDLQQTLATVINSMALFPATGKNNITIEPFFCPLVPQFIDTDGRRLQQIIYNLLSNAVKFSKQNGMVHLNVSVGTRYFKAKGGGGKEDQQPLLRSSVRSNGQPALCISVKDFGQGIAESEFHKLFEPFQQTECGKAQGQGGTGLGLPIVKQLVELLGGSISVDSKVGEWTEFSLQFTLNVPLPNTEKIASKLKKSCVWLVSNQEKAVRYTSTACRHYLVPHRHFTSLKELTEQSESLGANSSHNSHRACIVLVQANLYDEETYDRFLRGARAKIFLVAIGRCGTVDRAQLAIPVPRQVFPSVFMQQLGTLLKSKNKAPTTLEKKRPESPPINYEKLKVLVAEDNLVNQKVLGRLLSRIGVSNVKMAVNGQIAVDLEAEESFDIVFMDMQMPVMGGVEACKRIVAAKNTTPPLPHRPKVVFLSANVIHDHESFCRETGASDYLTKPCTLVDLRAMIEKLTSSDCSASMEDESTLTERSTTEDGSTFSVGK